MRWFYDLPISRKLTVAFAAVIALTIALGVFSIVRMRIMDAQETELTEVWMPSVRHLLEMRGVLGEYRTAEIQQLNFGEDPVEVADYETRLTTFKQQFDDAQAAYEPLISSDEERALYAPVLAGKDAYFGAHDRIASALGAGDLAGAKAISDEESRAARRQLIADINALLEFNATALEAFSDDAHASAQQSQWLVQGGLVAVVLVSGLFAWWISRVIARPLASATRVAEGIAAGHLDAHIVAASRDETGQLLGAMRRMQEQLRAVIEAMAEMQRQHDAGAISYRIPAASFPGQYGALAEGTNALVNEHIKTKMRVVELMHDYSEGDLRQEMEQLPGEKARITEATRAVRDRLGAINQQIQRLARAAAAGDFSVRGDEAAFSHEFQRMVQGLNQVMQVSDTALTEVSRVLQAIAEGDLTQRVQGRFEGVFADMQRDANTSTQRLADIVGGIQNAAEQITTAAREISTGNQDLSRRTEGQAANLEETAASMEELTSTVKQNADSARTANQLATSAAEVAGQGGQIIRDVVTTMDGISGSSRKVGEIISVIDGIAFQTNILALNAAVEAARAGEQGRGFAVVASEVRSLAQRSAAAAKEIKDLISDSIARVDQGATLVGRAGSTMEEIVSSVRRVNDIMSEISAASAEQSSGIEQVNQTVTHLDEATQQNAALVEEATAAARSMEEQADALVESVGVFRIA